MSRQISGIQLFHLTWSNYNREIHIIIPPKCFKIFQRRIQTNSEDLKSLLIKLLMHLIQIGYFLIAIPAPGGKVPQQREFFCLHKFMD